MKKSILLRVGMGWVILFAALVAGGSLKAADKTAFDLAKEGNKYVGADSKDRVVQIRSEKSIGSLSPATWYVVYYDPSASMKSVSVKFVGGNMMEVKRPIRLLEAMMDKQGELNQKDLKIDSNKALKLALAEPVLEKLTIVSAKYKLEAEGFEPVWKIELWSASVKDPHKEIHLGEIWVSAKEGKILQDKVQVNRAD